jgi:hypothetical protein
MHPNSNVALLVRAECACEWLTEISSSTATASNQSSTPQSRDAPLFLGLLDSPLSAMFNHLPIEPKVRAHAAHDPSGRMELPEMLKPPTDFGSESEPLSMRRSLILLLGAYLIGLNLLCLALVFMVWPGMKEMLPRFSLNPPDEIRLMLISTVAGALGSSVVLLLSFVSYVGNRRLLSSWAWWYVARPIAGMTVGLFVYIAIRGGILKTGSNVSVDVLNPYSVATIAALGGAFSKEILDKMKSFAERQFSSRETGHHRDSLK